MVWYNICHKNHYRIHFSYDTVSYTHLSLHGDMKQEFRSRVMEQFRSGNYPILIATDVAARGIDVDDIDLVVNFDIPQDNEYYIHRVGRTGRAGKKGLAITLVSGGKQRAGIRDIIRYTKTNIVRHALPTSAQMMEANRNAFVAKMCIRDRVKGGLPLRVRDLLMRSLGLCTLFIGISGAISAMMQVDGTRLQANGTLLLICSLGIGAVAGELLRCLLYTSCYNRHEQLREERQYEINK